jgi:Glycosyltransferase family 87
MSRLLGYQQTLRMRGQQAGLQVHRMQRALQSGAASAGYHRRIDKLATKRSNGALIHRRGAFMGLVAALVAAASLLDTLLQRGSDGLFNDFYDYWLAARVLGSGGNPYDTAAMTAAAGHAGLHFTLGTGYSYPLLFGYLCLPLTVLPPVPAAIVFSALSMLALGLAVAILATPLGRLGMAELLVLGALAGGLTPISGSLYFGQANLVLLPLLALAWRGVARPLALGLATAVKLYPAAALAAIAAGGRRSLGLLGATVSAMLALTVLPNLLARMAMGSGPTALFLPDPFWTNQSVNGLLSRLSMSSEFTRPPLPGLPVAPVEVTVLLLLGGGAMALMVLRKGRPWAGCLSLALAFGVVAAPKNSLWNYAPLLLVVFFCWPLVRRRAAALAVLLAGLALVEIQAVIDYFRHSFYTSPGLTWLSSLALYGALLLIALNAYLLLLARDETAPDTEPTTLALEVAA